MALTERTHLLHRPPTSGLDAFDALPFLEKVINVAPGIIYVFNQTTMSNEYSNHSLGESLGYSGDEIQAMGAELMPTLCHPDDLDAVFAHFETIRNLQDGVVVQIEYRMCHKDGHWAWLLSQDTVFDRNADGTVLRHIGLATDISLQKEAEFLAIREKNSADEANAELQAFAYSISHDLKSPSNTLSMLLTEIEHVRHDSEADDIAELLSLCRVSVTRMQAMIEDVLRYTRVVGHEEGTGNVDLAKTVAAIIEDLRSEIDENSAEISVESLPRIPGMETQLRILFQNLIENALRYRKADVAPKIQIIGRHADDAQSITVSVADNGIGIDPSKHQRIFRLFERLHRQDEYPGTGLGLATCRRITTNHGGTIAVDSEPGKGATFLITLPAS